MSHKIPVTGTLNFNSSPLQEASTSELLDELTRRSVGCLVVALRAEELPAGKQCKGPADRWHYRVKGSTVLLAAMDAALAIEIHRSVHLSGDGGLTGQSTPHTR